MNKKTLFTAFLMLTLVVTGSYVTTVSADHSWGNYHWARTANPFTLKLGDNLSSNWDTYLTQASADWSVSSVLDTVVVPGVTSPRNCRAVAGRIEVCNSRYGSNGWLGIASVWASGEHITQGTVKMNDTYFNTAKYNTPAWKSLVVCQEIGHVFGLDHQDEDFGNMNLGTCMDYTNNPGTNQHPNAHDYDMLETIYAHMDSVTTIGQTPLVNKQAVDHADSATWGKEIRRSGDGRSTLYERDLGRGGKIFTFVVWATE